MVPTPPPFKRHLAPHYWELDICITHLFSMSRLPLFGDSSQLVRPLDFLLIPAPLARQVAEQMTLDGLEKVHKEAVANISNWKRNEEWVYMLQPRLLELPMLGLGGSVAGNVQGQVVAVADREELQLRADEVRDRTRFSRIQCDRMCGIECD